MSRRFGENREFGVRFNGSYHNGDTPLDNQGREAHVGAAAFDYRGNRFRASLDFIDQEEKFDAPTRPFLVATGIAVPSAPDGRRNVTQPWEWSKIHDKSLLARTEYDVTEAVTVFADAGGGRTQVDRLFGTPTILNSAGDTTSTPGHFKFDIERNVADAGLRARFDTAAISHTVTFQEVTTPISCREAPRPAPRSCRTSMHRSLVPSSSFRLPQLCRNCRIPN